MGRLTDLRRFYDILEQLERGVGGKRTLAVCDGRMDWPGRGVYFFFETGEVRQESGKGPRVVRVGTHALTSRSRTTLWNRLSQHRGTHSTGGGNHRGSIFRLIIGEALMERGGRMCCETWGRGANAIRDVRVAELPFERQVSQYIGAMPFLWVPIEDPSGRDSLRGVVERGSIALLSNFDKPKLDPPTRHWLGHHCPRPRLVKSGLWNSNHVDEDYDPEFLDVLRDLATNAESLVAPNDQR